MCVNACLRNSPLATGLVPVVLRLVTTLVAEKRTLLPALAAGGGEGRQQGNSWVAKIDGSCQTLYHRDQPGGDKATANKVLR